MNRITKLFGIQYPVIQAGMVWCSGWKLASAVSEAGGLGIIGAGSMTPEVLEEHITKYQAVCNKPFAVNLPLLYAHAPEHVEVIVRKKVPIVFSSAGSPDKWTGKFKEHGITVVHVVSSSKFAFKAEQSGCDAVVAEGFEAGGHNGREETTTLCLIPAVVNTVKIPVIAAGGIATGSAMLACFALGAEGVQIGTRFAASVESSASDAFKKRVLEVREGDTELLMKQVTPVRMIKNEFYKRVKTAELHGASPDELRQILGRGRSRKGIFEGDLEEGELEIGQIAAIVEKIQPAGEILREVWEEFLKAKENLLKLPK
jgi:enoyl-[acyl-carrier protein] reductase II